MVAERKFRRDLSDRKPGRLRRECGRPRHARIHLNRNHPPIGGVHRKLDVRTAGFDTDPAYDSPSCIAHPLILLVGQRHRRCDGNAVTGVHSHRVNVLDRAHNDEIVGRVAHDLKFELLPPDDRFLDEDLVYGT